MEKQQLNDYLLNKQIRKEAMKEISSDFALTEAMMREYRNELDWSEVSQNRNIMWSASMIEFLKRRIDWSVFSSHVNEKALTPNIIERFKDNWDWKELSGNECLHLSYELVDKYVDKWDWPSLINNVCYRLLLKALSPVEFVDLVGLVALLRVPMCFLSVPFLPLSILLLYNLCIS